MFWGILQRAIFWELVKAFLMSLAALTSILLLAGIVAEASQHGLSPAQILLVIPLIIPSTLPYTIPSTTLFAICVVYGRLAHDNEIIAIKAAGVHLLRVVGPGILLGLATSAITFGLYLYVIPETQYLLRAKFLQDAEEFFYTMLKNERTVQHPKLNYAIWVRQVQGRRLLDATFKRRDAKGDFDVIARAREAELLFDHKNGKVLVRMRHGEVYNVPTNTHAFFENQDWEERMPEQPIGPELRKRKAREMNWLELYRKHDELQGVVDQLAEKVAQKAAQLHLASKPSLATLDLQNHKNNLAAVRNELRAVDNELHMRPVLAGGCLCFVLVGCPVGIWFSKRDYLSAFITCFLPIVFVYYPLLLCGDSLVRSGRLPASLGLWASNLAVGLAGVYLLRRLLRN